jgi:hypothetical protein
MIFPRYKATLFMKSGNKITLWFVKDIKIKYSGNTITALDIFRYNVAMSLPIQRLFGASIDLSQIEAIVFN